MVVESDLGRVIHVAWVVVIVTFVLELSMTRQHSFLWLTLGLCVCIAPQAQESTFSLPAEFSPGSDTFFAVQARAMGKVTFSKGAVSTALSNTTLTATTKYEKPQKVRAYAVCLAGGEYGGKWDIVRCSKEVKVSVALVPGQSATIPDQSLVIDIRGLATIERTWLVLRLKTSSDTYMFTHSQKDIFE